MTSLNPSVTVGEQVAESLKLHQYGGRRKDSWFNAVREILPKISRDVDDEVREETIEVLEEVGIPEPGARIDEYPHEFSGGMRQRVLIAIALACQPGLLVADEPTTALDVTIQAQILDLIDDLQADLGMSVLMITHDLGVVAETCDRVAVMYAGEIVEEGPVEEIFGNPSHPYTYTLLESPPSEEKERLAPIEGNVPDLIDMPSGSLRAAVPVGDRGVYERRDPVPPARRRGCRPSVEVHHGVVRQERVRRRRCRPRARPVDRRAPRRDRRTPEVLRTDGQRARPGSRCRRPQREGGRSTGSTSRSTAAKRWDSSANPVAGSRRPGELLHLKPTDGRVVFAGTDLTELDGSALRAAEEPPDDLPRPALLARSATDGRPDDPRAAVDPRLARESDPSVATEAEVTVSGIARDRA